MPNTEIDPAEPYVIDALRKFCASEQATIEPPDPEPHPAAASHVHPPLWREFAEAASTYALAAVLIVMACFAVGLSCGAATLGYRLLSESGVAQ